MPVKRSQPAPKAAQSKPAANAKPSKAVAVPPSKTVATVNWREQAAKSVAAGKVQTAKLPAESGNFISFRNGVITVAGRTVPSPLALSIVAYGYERAYYARAFDPNQMATPDCYSFDGEAPHEKAPTPQADACAKCRFNEFGSADNGKGKGCKEGVRFAGLPAAALDDVAAVATVPLVQGRLSVMNAKGFRAYAETLDSQDVAMWQGITSIDVQPDSRTQYSTDFSMDLDVVIEEDTLNAVAARVEEGEALIVAPYPVMEEAPKAAPPARPAARRRF